MGTSGRSGLVIMNSMDSVMWNEIRSLENLFVGPAGLLGWFGLFSLPGMFFTLFCSWITVSVLADRTPIHHAFLCAIAWSWILYDKFLIQCDLHTFLCCIFWPMWPILSGKYSQCMYKSIEKQYLDYIYWLAIQIFTCLVHQHIQTGFNFKACERLVSFNLTVYTVGNQFRLLWVWKYKERCFKTTLCKPCRPCKHKIWGH